MSPTIEGRRRRAFEEVCAAWSEKNGSREVTCFFHLFSTCYLQAKAYSHDPEESVQTAPTHGWATCF